MKNFDTSYICERIASLRIAKKLSARALSLLLGQSSEYINQIENGRSLPSIEGLLNICDFFEISISDFFDNKTKFPLEYQNIFAELNKLDTEELENLFKVIKMTTKYKK